MDTAYTTVDLSVFLGYFVLVVVIGFVASRGHVVSVGGYFRGGNRLPYYAIGLSIVAAGVSSEQFVGEMGYAYKVGMPVANWEWLVFPALSILLWIFVPLYVRNRITTMPEYLEQRLGPSVRTLYAWLSVASYVFVNFALVFYTGGLALEAMWGVDKLIAVWVLAAVTGLYTVYGGLSAVAWTSSFQCVLLLGGGLFTFVAGMSKIGWDFQAVLGTGQQAHLMTPADHPEVPWTAFLILALSTNVWYYATNQYINQRCLAARNEWHAKMGVLLAGGLQLLLPLAVCFPGMIYRVINPNLEVADTAYPMMVAEVVPLGLRGLIAAAVVGAIMSTISGLVNSTSTIFTLDIVGRSFGREWSEERLVRIGRWSGAIALIIGAGIAPLVMRWDNIFRYAQEIWAPMAAPVVVVFLCAALWRNVHARGALACLWLAVLTVPLSLTRGILADMECHFLPTNLDNPLVLAGAVSLVSWAMMALLCGRRSLLVEGLLTFCVCVPILLIAATSPIVTALLVAATMLVLIGVPLLKKTLPTPGMWDRTMLASGTAVRWYSSVWTWWLVLAFALAGIYAWFW